MIRDRKRLAVAAALVVVVLAARLFAVQLIRHQRAAASLAQQCSDVTKLAEQLPAAPAHPAVAVLGDSYAEGMELPDPAKAWPFLAFPSVAVDAIGGTGFTTDGPCDGQSFQQRAAHVLTFGAPLVVVQGGLNDWNAPADELQRAAEQVLGDLERDADSVILIGPALAPARNAGAVRAVDETLSAAAEATGAAYISTLDWPLTFGPDGVHMTAESHQEYASRVAASIHAH